MRILTIAGIFLIFSACAQQTDKRQSDSEFSDSSNYVSVVLQVNGMTCTDCENAISKGVESLEGIKKVNASHIDSTTLVVYDSSCIGIDLISEKIAEIGYEVEGVIK